MDEENRKNEQKKGIERAKKEGVYAGRKRKEVDEELLIDLIGKFQKRKVGIGRGVGNYRFIQINIL